MGQIQTATYKRNNNDPTSVIHEIRFAGAGPGNRLIVVQSSYQPLDAYESGWELVTYTSADGHFLAVFTKIAQGGENSFTVWLMEASRVCHMWMVERDDMPEFIDAWSGRTSGRRTFTLEGAGYIVGGFHYGGEGTVYASWPAGMYVAHRATNTSSSSYTFSSDFAHKNLSAGTYTIDAAGMAALSGYAYTFAVFGKDATPPTSPRRLTILEQTADTVRLGWDASSDDTGVTYYSVYVNGQEVGQTTYTDYLFTGLPSGQPVTLGVAAWDAEGNRSQIATITVTLDGTPPTVPARVRLVAMTTTSLTVTWEPSTDTGTGLAGYGVYLNGIKVAEQTGRTYTFTDLVTDRQYVIEVDAVDKAGNRSSRAVLRATPKVDVTPPETPRIWVTRLDRGVIGIRWDEPADDSAVASYSVYLGNAKVADQTGQEYTFTGLNPGGVYLVGVEAIDLAGNRSQRGVRSIRAEPDTTPPTVPGNFRLVAVTQTSATVTWDASTDDNAGVASYRLYLGGNAIADITSQVYTITGLAPGIGYRLAVDAVDQVGNRSAKAQLSITTKPDTSGAAPPYEYVFVDWATHAPIDSLPLKGVTFELTLREGGEVQASIPLYDRAYTIGRVAAATRKERTILAIYRGDRFVWGGRVVDPEEYDSETGLMRITAENPVGIYGRRFVAFTGPRLGTYAHTEVQWLLEHTATATDRRWLRFAGVAGTQPMDLQYRADEFPRILEEVNKVAESEGGFEWWVKPVWDSENDRPMFELRRVSRDNPPDTGLVLEYPGNVKRYRVSTQRGLETVTYGKLQISDGGVLLAKVVKQNLLDAGWPLLEEVYQFERLTSREALDIETQRAATAAAGPKNLYEFTLLPGTGVKWWDLELGGLARVVISDHRHPEKEDGSPGLDRMMKIVSIRVTPDSEQGEQVVITTGEFTVDVE